MPCACRGAPATRVRLERSIGAFDATKKTWRRRASPMLRVVRERIRERRQSVADHCVHAIQSSTSKVKGLDADDGTGKLPNTIQCDTGDW